MVFKVIFQNGFGITDRIGVLHNLLQSYDIDIVSTTFKFSDAYYECCKTHVDKLISPYESFNAVYLPTFEEAMQRPFFTNNPKPPSSERYFACFSWIDYGIVKSVGDVLSFVTNCIEEKVNFEIKQEVDFKRTRDWLNWKISLPAFYFSAYCTSPIPQLPQEIAIDTLFENPMPNFFKKTVKVPKNLPYIHQLQLPTSSL